MKKMRSYISLTEVFLSSLNLSLKGFIIGVKYSSLTRGDMKEIIGKIHNTEPSLPKNLLMKKKRYSRRI